MISSMISFTVLILFVYTTSAVKISNGSLLHGIQFPNHPSFNSATSSVDSGCQTTITASALDLSAKEEKQEGGVRPAKPPLKVHLKHRATNLKSETDRKETVKVFTHRDLLRIHTLHRRITEGKNQNTVSRLATSTSKTKFKSRDQRRAKEERPTTQLVATLESGVSLGSGEYFMDVYIGTPPKHFSLILDTGSDLNWIQCVPCHDCFEQQGNPYDPKDSSSFRNISCVDPQCKLVSSPDPPRPCKSANQTCQYFYWYGDQSNTTGDFAMETFTVNLTSHNNHELELRHVENVLFGCGHWNRGLFHGAAGLLGLGRGPLSFSSQLRSLYGDTFSYCLVDRNSNISISSKLIFGEDERLMSHPNLNFTSLVSGKENPVDTFYYVQIKGIMVGKELLNIPAETWQISSEGAGGMIIDSGTTLSYFAEPAYKIIKEAFEKKVKYPKTEDFPVLDPCYNVTGIEKVLLPEFSILFADGAVWDFPVENYFIRLDPEELICLAILGTPRSSLSILGNYQQQNFHIQYDTNKSRLGFAPMKCADV